MAEIEKVEVGDRLRIDVEVIDITNDADYPIRVEANNTDPVWLWRAVAEAAAHMPASKVFNRGDWVRHTDGIRKNGLVLGRNKEGSLVYVEWPGSYKTSEYLPQALEHDEAPE